MKLHTQREQQADRPGVWRLYAKLVPTAAELQTIESIRYWDEELLSKDTLFVEALTTRNLVLEGIYTYAYINPAGNAYLNEKESGLRQLAAEFEQFLDSVGPTLTPKHTNS